MADTARRVVAQKHLVRIVDAIDPVHREEVPHSFGEHDQLRPARSGVVPWGGNREAVGRLHRDEIFTSDHLGLYRLHPVAELGPLDLPLRATAMKEGRRVGVIPVVVQHVLETTVVVRPRLRKLIPVRPIAARLHDPVHDHKTVAGFAEAAGFVEKRALFDAGHPVLGVLLGNDGFEFVGLDLDSAIVLVHACPFGVFRRLGQDRSGACNRDDQPPCQLGEGGLGKSHESSPVLHAVRIRARCAISRGIGLQPVVPWALTGWKPIPRFACGRRRRQAY